MCITTPPSVRWMKIPLWEICEAINGNYRYVVQGNRFRKYIHETTPCSTKLVPGNSLLIAFRQDAYFRIPGRNIACDCIILTIRYFTLCTSTGIEYRLWRQPRYRYVTSWIDTVLSQWFDSTGILAWFSSIK